MDLTRAKPHHARRTLSLLLAATLAVWILIFLGWVAYYLWQSKYGTIQEITQTRSEFQSEKFTLQRLNRLGDKGKLEEDGPKAPPNWADYITKNNPTFGSSVSPVTITAFIDFECPFSQESYQTFKSVAETYGSAAKVVFKQLPLTSIHSNALPAAEAAACAHDQGKFLAYYDYLFATKRLSPADLTAGAAAIGLDLNTFKTCQQSAKYRAAIEQDVNDAITLGVRGTPTYFVNNDVIEGVVDRSVWDTIILRNLKK